WEMPVYYSSITEEHQAVRQCAGLFDTSHMGQFLMTGSQAESALQHLTPNNIKRLQSGQCQYSAFLNENGMFIDDIILYKYHSEKFFICVNACNTEKDFRWVKDHLKGNAIVQDVSRDYALLALQGPQAESIIRSLTPDPQSLKGFHFMETQIGGIPLLISRTGYTGEDGFEIYIPTSSPNTASLWSIILEKGQPLGLRPAGLGARDTLRLEAAYSLYGHEINDQTTPWEAQLGWIVKMNGDDFIGKKALEQAREKGLKKIRIGIEMSEKGIARQDYPIEYEGRIVGKITSGTLSPTLLKAIAIGYIDPKFSAPGTKIHIDIRGKKRNANIVSLPFYKREI
ncbi:MAG: hypothetical protein A3F89_00730, partial [Deltaproteobacteria bacterium RIFCSPLOWO2_12_FULL_50_11]